MWAYQGISKSHWEHGLDYREGDERSWCLSWSNSLWQGWCCGLVYCLGGNATDPIWRVLASSDGITSWTPLQSQHSNSNPNPLANQLLCTYSPHASHHPSQTPCLPWISYSTQKLMLDSCKMVGRKVVWSIPYVSVAFFPSLKRNFIAYHSSKVSDYIFEIHPQWQSGFSRVNSNSCSSCSFESEVINIGQSSHKMIAIT